MQVVYGAVQAPGAFQGLPVDTDGFMRLVRVERLVETGAWFDGTIPRSNWPFGEVSHWTRPLDVLILALAAPARLVIETRASIAFGGVLISPLLHLAAALALYRASVPLLGGAIRPLVLPLFLVQAGILGYGSAGRADHHMLILLLHIVLLGAALRLIRDPGRWDPAALAGLAAAAGIWVSPELLLPLALVLVTQGVVWCLDGDRHARGGLILAGTLFGGLFLALLMERGPADGFTAVSYDRISRVHLEMAGVAVVFWGLVKWMGRTSQAGGSVTRTRKRRLTQAAAMAGVLVGTFALLRPRFFLGPWADVDPAVAEIWLQKVQELQPLLGGPWWRATAAALLFLGPAAVVLPFLILRTARDPRPLRRMWLFLLLSLMVYVPLAVAQVRFTALAGPVLALGMAAVIGHVLPGVAHSAGPGARRVFRVAVMAGLTVGFLLAGALVEAVGGAASGPDRGGSNGGGAPDACSPAALAGVLGTVSPGTPRTVAAFMDHGPELLYSTHHRVLATPYHRNREGLLDTWRLFRLPDGPELRALVREREVDLVVICPPRDRGYYEAGPGSLYRRIDEGTPPAWLREMPRHPSAGAFRLMEVVDLPPG